MKRFFVISCVAVFLYLLVGVIQIHVRNRNAHFRTKAERDVVKAELKILYAYLGKMRSVKGELPATWALMPEPPPRLSEPIAFYELHPAAAQSEPLVVYKGEKLRAKGYYVGAYGVVNHGNVKRTRGD